MESIRYKILLVEDNTLDQTAFKRFVDGNEIPYDYMIVDSVAGTKSILDHNQFDIIITDHCLGDGTALDVLESAGNTPVVVVTGAGDEETAARTWKAGAYDYLVKDINQNYLKAIPKTVENTINHKLVEEKVQLLSGAVMSTGDSVYITDTSGKIIFVNKAFCRTYGYKEEEIVGQNGSVLWIGKNQSKTTRSVFQTKVAGSNWEVGFYHRRKDDSVFPVSLSRAPIKNAAGHDVAIVAVVRDITERIITENKIRTASLKLKKRNELQNEIAILVSEAVQKLLADDKIDTAQKIIADYLDISKIEADKMELVPTKFDLAELIAKTVEDLRPQACELNIELENTTLSDEIHVSADPVRVAQILRCLLSRAIKSPTATNHVSVEAKDTGDEFTVEIHDDGLPLEHGEIDRITNCSEWISEQFQAGREETALGMQLAVKLVEMNGGRIWNEKSDSNQNKLYFTVSKSDAPSTKEISTEMSAVNAI